MDDNRILPYRVGDGEVDVRAQDVLLRLAAPHVPLSDRPAFGVIGATFRELDWNTE